MGCLGDETIAAYVDGALDLDDVARVDRHVDACAACRSQLSAMAAAPVVRSFVTGVRASAPTIRVATALAEVRDTEPVSGFAIGRYVVASVIGRGAMGMVLRAHDPELERAVAIKLVDPALRKGGASWSTSGSWRARLRTEARAMARLRHPNVVAVYDAGTFGDQMFIAMELVDGESLAQRVARDRRGTLALCIGAGRGLCAAHAAGIVHGDIKPDNILVDRDERALLGDFGLARAAAESADGELVGTPFYMAPELLRRERADERTDQFAFAVTVYEALTGTRPWHATALAELVRAIQTLPPCRPDAISPAVWRVIARGLAVDPAARYGSVAELVAELERAADLELAEAATTQTLEPTVATRIDDGFVALVPGTVVGDYEIERLLGAGAMAHVYGARHERIGKRVAIKVIAPRLSRHAELVDRFEREARALAQLSHPNIVDIIGFGHIPADGRSYYVMDWLEGESLEQRISRGRVPLAEALHVIDQIARALAAAHGRGVIHRDLKPANVWLRHVEQDALPVVKLLDFGLAKLAPELDTLDAEPTQAGVTLGTARYMSPEQALSSRDVDPATDIYALGCTAFEVICGRLPFDEHGVPEPRTGIPAAVDRLLAGMLDKDPARRPGLTAIRGVIAEVAATLAPATPPRRARRYMLVAAIATGIAAIGALAIASRWVPGQSAAPRREVAVPAPATTPAAPAPAARAITEVPPAPVAEPPPPEPDRPAVRPRPKPRPPAKPAAPAKPPCDPYERAEGC